jgi:hypothetical protein
MREPYSQLDVGKSNSQREIEVVGRVDLKHRPFG